MLVALIVGFLSLSQTDNATIAYHACIVGNARSFAGDQDLHAPVDAVMAQCAPLLGAAAAELAGWSTATARAKMAADYRAAHGQDVDVNVLFADMVRNAGRDLAARTIREAKAPPPLSR